MADFLTDQAVRDIWCAPAMDFEHILQLQRITDERGVVGNCQILLRSVFLPTSRDRYHVYQIGQIHPNLLGLMMDVDTWTTVAQVCRSKLVFANLYSGDGRNFPLAESYFLYTSDRVLVIAVKEQPTIAPLRTTGLYLRMYSNAYYASRRSDPTTQEVDSRFYRHTNVIDGLAFQNLYQTYQRKPGFVWLYLNGMYVDSFVPMTLNVGDVLEFIHDSSVKKVVDFPVANLSMFESLLDLKRKYLLHYAGAQVGGPLIDYRDDCDLHLLKPNTNGGFSGSYFHKNQDDAFRQVTHRDYSICIPYMAAYLQSFPQWGDIKQLTVRLAIRYAGFARPLVYEANHVQELYKLKESDRVNAFLGINSNVSVWRADNLENSAYVKVMDAAQDSLTRQLVEDAYGYNAISRLIGDSPALLSDAGYIKLGPVLWRDATMYEYDTNGLLLGWYPHVLGAEYTPVYPGCAMVESVVGVGSMSLDQVMGQQDVLIDPTLSYRFYVAPIDQGRVVNGLWQDVTGDQTKYAIVDGKLHWFVDMNSYQTCVKSDKDCLAYDQPLSPTNGLLRFSIRATSNYPDGDSTDPLAIPPGQLDLWLNGHALIENLDYYVNWPQVVLVNKAYLIDGNSQKVTVRASGFCKSDMSREVAQESAFVRWGVLSHNDRFNLRDDKVIRIVANGRVFHRSQVIFSEDQIQASLPDIPNGSPYAVTDVIVPVRGFTPSDTYAILDPARVVNKQISDYMTLKLPDQIPSGADIIEHKYAVYSPFTSTIAHDLVNGMISMGPFKGHYSNKELKDRLAPYVYLLEYDPTQRNVDLDHVIIHPHNLLTIMELSIYQYNFLSRAIHLFLDDKVDMSRFFSINQDWD